jgi:hypothetical protein
MNIRQFSKLPEEEQLKLLFKRVEKMKKEKLTTREVILSEHKTPYKREDNSQTKSRCLL